MHLLQSGYAYLKGLNYTYLCVLGLLVKSIIYGINYPDVLLTVPVLGFEGYKLYIQSRTPQKVHLDAELRKELDNIRDKMGAIDIAKTTKPQGNVRYF